MDVSSQAELRAERSGDLSAILDLHREAFAGHGDRVAALVREVSATQSRDDPLSLVATIDARIVGHALFTRNLLDAPARLVAVQVLSPIAVDPAQQHRGIGTALVRRGLGILADAGVPAVFLEGDPRYYARFGFMPAERAGFRKPSLRIPDAGFQVLKLPAYEPWMTGTLVYREAFWSHDLVGLRDEDGSEGDERDPGQESS